MKVCAGFSLIEVLLATLLAAILGIILFTAYNQVHRITRSIDDYVDVYSKEALLQNLLSRDISGAFIPIQAQAKEKPLEQIFVYEPEAEATRFKSFTFITNNPTVVYGSAKPRVARVRYTLKEEKNMQATVSSYTLIRQESDSLNLNEFTKEGSAIRSYEVVTGIKKITFTFTKMIKKEQKIEPEVRQAWQSEIKKEQSEQREIVLPQLVSFTITLWDNEKKREREFFGSVLIAAMIDAQIEEPEKEAAQASSPQAQQQPEQPVVTPQGAQSDVGGTITIQEARVSVQPQKKTEIIIVQEDTSKKPMRQRSPTIISQLSTGDTHAV
jgi:type II secretory pathway component PulJ